MSSKVLPEPADLRQSSSKKLAAEEYAYEDGSWTEWVKKRWWAVALVTLLICGVIIAVVVGPVCAVRGCPAKSKGGDEDKQNQGPPRLIVNFNLEDIDALDVVPAILRQYTSRLKIDSSFLQILDFIDEDVLQEAQTYLKNHPELNFLVRDFALTSFPNVTNDAGKLGDLGALLSGGGSAANGTINGLLDQLSGLLNSTAPSSNSTSNSTTSGSTNSTTSSNSTMGTSQQRRRKLQQQAQATVNDPLVRNGTQWHHAKIFSEAAWSITRGLGDVIVAVIDTGFAVDHPDLVPSLWVNKGEIPGNGIDDDGNGFIDDVNGWDFAGGCKNGTANTGTTKCVCEGRPTPLPFDRHGTHTAGLVGSAANNTLGGSGMAPGSRLMLLRVADCVDGTIYSSYVALALDYAFKMGAHIVSMSLGMNYPWMFAPDVPAPLQHADWIATYTAAIKPLTAKNMLVVGAAGNEALSVDNLFNYGYSYNPCLVQLDNVICIAATDSSDKLAFFSNYGATKVHIAAPGQQIFSTLWESKQVPMNTYGPLNGTSMATPIVSGIAALVTSVLGAGTGSYYRALQVKDIILKSGDIVPGLAPYTVTSMRVNALSAVRMALEVATASNATTSVTPALPATAITFTSTVSPGWNETYWTNTNPSILDTFGQTRMDRTFRASLAPTFVGFKYSAGVMAVMQAYVRLNTSGIHNFRITTTAPPTTYRLFVNNQPVFLSSGIGAVSASGPGFYLVEVRYGAPTARLDLALRPPSAVNYTTFDGQWLQIIPTPWTLPTYMYNYTTTNGWVAFFNRSTVTTYNSTLNVLSQQVTLDRPYTNVAYIPDLNYVSGAFQRALFPSDATVSSAIGYMYTTINPNFMPGTGNTTNFQMRITCKGCAVAINGLTVIENWESHSTSGSTTKFSACMSMQRNVRNMINVTFASTPLSQAAMVLQYAPCGSIQFVAFGATRVSPVSAMWQPSNFQVLATIGYIGGLQCDVWRSTTNRTAVIPANTPPTFKVRLPRCPSPDIMDATTCSTTYSFSVNTLVPSGLSTKFPATTTFSLRCWTFLTTNFASAPVVLPTTVASNAWLAGANIWSRGTGTAATTPFSWAPAPNIGLTGGNLQHFAVEWYDVPITQTISVNVGANPMPVDYATMRLPIAVIPDPDLSMSPLDMTTMTYPIGAAGIYSQALLPNFQDTLGTVANDLDQVCNRPPAGVFSSLTTGLDAAVSYTTVPATLLNNIVRYAKLDSYLFTPAVAETLYTYDWRELNASTTAIVMDQVVVRNAPPFNATIPAQAAIFQVFLPSGFVKTQFITKTQRFEGTTGYNMSLVGPIDWAVGQMTVGYTYRPAWQPQMRRRGAMEVALEQVRAVHHPQHKKRQHRH